MPKFKKSEFQPLKN